MPEASTSVDIGDRCFKFDNARYILISFVVWAHLASVYVLNADMTATIDDQKLPDALRLAYVFLHLTIMPVFCLISGHLKTRQRWEIEIAIAFSMCVCFSLMDSLLGFLLADLPAHYLGWQPNSFRQKYPIRGFPRLRFSIWRRGSVLWYLWAVTFFKLIRPIVEQLRWPIAIVSILAALSVLTDAGQNLMCSFAYAPFFTIGAMLPYDKLVKPTMDLRLLVGIGALAIIIALANVLGFLSGSSLIAALADGFLCTLSDDGDGSGARCASLVQVFLRLGWYACAAYIGRTVLAIIPSRPIPYVSGVGKRTLQVYVFHVSFIHYLYPTTILLSVLFNSFLRWGISAAVAMALLLSQLAVAILSMDCVGTLLKPFAWMAFLFEGSRDDVQIEMKSSLISKRAS